MHIIAGLGNPGLEYRYTRHNAGFQTLDILAEELHIPLLGQIPLVQSIREGGDEGTPIALQAGHPAAEIFHSIAEKLAS